MHHGTGVSAASSSRIEDLIGSTGGLPAPVLAAGPLDPIIASRITGLTAVAPFRPDFYALQRAGIQAHPQMPDTRFASALLVAGRQRKEAMGQVAALWDRLEEGGSLIIDGFKTDGIESVAKALRAVVPVREQVTKAHGRAFRIEKTGELPGNWAEEAAMARRADGYWSCPGTFGWDKIDRGSELLASCFSDRLQGRAADFGAGWGFLAHRLLAASPRIKALDLIEADFRALEAARLNVPDERAAFHWEDVSTLRDRRYDLIVSNPPFHQGRAADPGLGQAFIAAASRSLAPSGRLLLVANRTLPYEATLAAAFAETSLIAQADGFKVIEARGAKSSRKS